MTNDFKYCFWKFRSVLYFMHSNKTLKISPLSLMRFLLLIINWDVTYHTIKTRIKIENFRENLKRILTEFCSRWNKQYISILVITWANISNWIYSIFNSVMQTDFNTCDCRILSHQLDLQLSYHTKQKYLKHKTKLDHFYNVESCFIHHMKIKQYFSFINVLESTCFTRTLNQLVNTFMIYSLKLSCYH